MKLFVFEWVDKLTSQYHCGGGLVIIAEDVREAKALIDQTNRDATHKFTEHARLGYDAKIEITEQEWRDAQIIDLAKPIQHPSVWVFRDAGCC